jgi:lipid A 3-O-deacylase
MVARETRRKRRRAALALLAAAALAAPAAARAQNLTYGEFKFGILAHDVHLLGGKEGGVDLNPEVVFPSPVADSWVARLPWYLRWPVQPRPAVGAEINTAGFTNQVYLGASWKWQVASNVLRPGDGITFGLFFGPSFNDGDKLATAPDRKSLGAHVLFRGAVEVGYRIDPRWEISVMFDHVSNAGLARQNQSINDFGGRIGFRF